MYTTLGEIPDHAKVKHYVGLPPEIASDEDLRAEMSPASVLVIVEHEDSGIFLYRFAIDGAVVGDTWHESVEEAQGQAQFEYGIAASSWRPISNTIGDDNLEDFVLSLAVEK